ncbi:MAG: ABC transporter permease [Candidatus Zixiibacteriota bacterium]
MFRAYFGIIVKELRQALRDRNTLRMLFVVPVVQLVVMGYAVNTDVKKLYLDVYDADNSQLSRELIANLRAAGYFVPSDQQTDADRVPVWQLENRFREGKAEMALIIPNDFSEKLQKGEPVTVGWISDGSDANAARTGTGYASQIVRTFSNRITGMKPNIELRSSNLFNPEAESVYFMVPGIVATLLTMLTLMMTSMAIVREREMGTLEQVLVTPISTITLMNGKITTYVILAMVVMALALTVGILWFHVPFVGSALLLVALSLLYLLSTLGMGMFVSTVTSTQQQAMFLAWFFSIFTMLTSGYFTPIANMPDWLQTITLVNPMRYFIDIVRGIMMKGSTFSDLYEDVIALAIFGPVLFGFSALRFHKRMS